MITRYVLFLLLSLGPFMASGQIPTTQDCLGAIPICQTTYTENFVPSGAGNYPNEVNPNSTCLGGGEIYSIWYTFTVNESGDFGFVLTPNNLSDDYDWALFNVTNASCEDIYGNPNLVVSCNFAGNDGCHGATGATGGTQYDIQGGGCYACPPSAAEGCSPMNALIPVEAGNTYVLMVSNWTQSNNGYSINFGISEVDIFDNQPPSVSYVDFPSSCTDQTIIIEFTENIRCGSIAAANFELIGPDNEIIPINSIYAANCSTGGEYDDRFILQLATPIPQNGSYTLQVNSDGSNDLLDNCGNAGESDILTFDVNFVIVPEVDLGGDRTFCEGTTVTLDASYPNASQVWQNGLSTPTLTVEETGTYTVTVSNVCGTVSDTVVLEMIPMITSILPENQIGCEGDSIVLSITEPNLNIEWFDGSSGTEIAVYSDGDYMVKLSNTCFEKKLETSVDFVDISTLALEQDIILCEGESHLFDVSINGGSYQWQDGSVESSIPASVTGEYTVSVSHQCGSRALAAHLEVIPEISFVLPPDTLACIGAPLLLELKENDATYLWDNDLETPVREIFFSGLYSATITSAEDCFEKEVSIEVKFIDIDTFDIQTEVYLCEGDTFNYNAIIDGAFSYSWSNGSSSPELGIDQSGIYVLNIDHLCGEIERYSFVDVIPKIEFDLGENRTMCEGVEFLNAYSEGPFDYRWQDNSTTPIFKAIAPGRYQVKVLSECEEVTQSVELKECERCEVAIPNVFSPNQDGLNDEFEIIVPCTVSGFELSIFDRWGSQLFHTKDVQQFWNGTHNSKALPLGVYVYTLKYDLLEGENTRTIFKNGTVTLLK